MVQLPLSIALLTMLVSISSAAAFSPRCHPIRELSVLATVKERQEKMSSRRFSTVDSTAGTGEYGASPVSIQSSQELKLQKFPRVAVSLSTVASIFVATVGTFLLNNLANLGPVKASSITGLLATLALPEKLALAAFCGSFAGMARMAVVPGIAGSLVLGVVCAAMMTLFDHKKWLLGVGGRLGFIAQCACTTQFLVSSLFLAPVAPAALIGTGPLDVKALTRQLPMSTALTVMGALFMRLWKKIWAGKSHRLANSVGAASATGLLAACTLPVSMAGPVFCGSFVAMSAPSKLARTKALVLASVLAGAAQQTLAGVLLGGWGGKLGTAALMGVLGYTFPDKLTAHKTESEK